MTFLSYKCENIISLHGACYFADKAAHSYINLILCFLDPPTDFLWISKNH